MTEWSADAYRRVSGLQRWLADKSLATLALRGDERVLDVGCGDGRVTADIAARVPHGSVLGVDASQNMIASAARTFPPTTYPNLNFRVADASKLAFAEEFGVVASFNCLHWVRDQAAALRGIRAALAPGGRTHLRMVARGQRTSLEAVIDATRRAKEWSGYFGGFESPYVHFTPDEYRALPEQNGLHVERIDMQDEAWDFESRDGFVAFAQGTFVEWTRRIPAERHLAFINDVLDRYGHGSVFKFYQMEVVLRPT